MNSGQLNELVRTTLAENNKSTLTLPVTALGQPDVISGVGVFIKIDPLDISKTFYVEEDTHTFDRNYHSMSLKLAPATDVGLGDTGNTKAETPEYTKNTQEILSGGEENVTI